MPVCPPTGAVSPEAASVSGVKPSGDNVPLSGITPPTTMNGGYSTVPKTAEYTEVTVETGLSDDDYIEILSGLEEGDGVIVESAERSGRDWTQMMMGGGMGGNMGGGPSGGRDGGPGGPGM